MPHRTLDPVIPGAADNSPQSTSEEEAQRIAATFGNPDFVYRPAIVRKGKATREISDGLLVCGGGGLILQVKERDRSSTTDDPARAAGWLRKSAAAGRKQGLGTRRGLATDPPTTHESWRGFPLLPDPAYTWPIVVLLDHPAVPPGVIIPVGDATLTLTLTDWRFLNERIRSVRGVVSYVTRVLAEGPACPLGQEERRYALFAAEDTRVGSGERGWGVLPASTLSGAEFAHADLLRLLITRVAEPSGPVAWGAPDEYREIVDVIDALPAHVQVDTGRALEQRLRPLEDHLDRPDGRVFRCIYSFDDGLSREDQQIVFLLRTNQPPLDERGLLPELFGLTRLRHTEFLSQRPQASRTLGVSILLDQRRGVQYGFSLLKGEVDPLPPNLVRWIESQYGEVQTVDLPGRLPKIGRNEICPCGSGKKYKHCCL